MTREEAIKFLKQWNPIHPAKQEAVRMAVKALKEPESIELDNITFGKWLKEVKEQNGYTLAQMAQIAGVSYYSIQKYITEHMPPTLDSVMRITKAFGKRIIIM